MGGRSWFHETEEFAAAFACTDNRVLAERYGVSVRTIIRRARDAGVTKAAQYLSGIAKERRATIAVPKGDEHYRWKGGKPWERFKDERYTAWRNAVLDRDGYVCRHCGRLCKKHEKGLAAHHLKPYADFPELRFDISNGVTLCRSCHMAEHRRPIRPPEKIECACGCGTVIDAVDPYGRPGRFVNRHGRRMGNGKALTGPERAKRSRDRKRIAKGIAA